MASTIALTLNVNDLSVISAQSSHFAWAKAFMSLNVKAGVNRVKKTDGYTVACKIYEYAQDHGGHLRGCGDTLATRLVSFCNDVL